MKRHSYTDEQIDFIIDHYKGISNIRLTNLFNEQFKTNLTVRQIRNKKYNLNLDSGYKSGEVHRVHALYRGEELLSIGTIEEIAEERGVSFNTIHHYKFPAYARRTKEGSALRLVCIEEEGEV